MAVSKLIEYGLSEPMYWIVFFISAFTENIFPPFPGDTVIIFGGYLYGRDIISFWTLYSAVYFGSVLGAVTMFYFGEQIAMLVLTKIKIWNLQKIDHAIEKIKKKFYKHNLLIIIFSRFSGGIRFFISIVAGMSQLHISLFILYFSLATVLWSSLLIAGGYLLGNNWENILFYLKVYNTVFIILLFSIVLTVIFWAKFHNKRNSEDN